MANYTPHDWGIREMITAELLNHMEQGILAATQAAEAAQSKEDLRAAFDMLLTETRTAIRGLYSRVAALEANQGGEGT